MATHDISLTVNGTDAELTVESRTLLVHALRDQLGYTGPKVGCESGSCGACTIHFEDEAVKSCLVLAAQADGASVTTVEGLTGEDGDGGGDLHPVQDQFRKEHGLQCGYCTPGMVMTTTAFLEDEPDPSREEVRAALKGNRCRCTGYHNIVSAIESLAGSDPSENTDDAGPASDESGANVSNAGDR